VKHGSATPRPSFGWGLADQTLASLTTLCLTIGAAREFGPSGVGAIAVPYAAILVVLGLQRALLVDPFMTKRWRGDGDERSQLAIGLTLSIVLGLLGLAACSLTGIMAPGAIGKGFIAFAPWIPPTLAQAFLRPAAFKAGRGWAAFVGSGVMLGTFLLAAFLGLRQDEAQLVSAWGLGALASSVWLLASVGRWRLARPLAAISAWRVESMRFGAWLAVGTVSWSVLSYGLLAGLATVTGTASLGGYRAIESIFSPLSLLAPSLAVPGMKTMSDIWKQQPTDVLRIAYRISGLAVVCMAIYALAVGALQTFIFSVLGDGFREYSNLIVPIALGQTVLAGTIGFITLLKVARQGRDVVVAGAGVALLACLVGIPLGAVLGITAAAWGIALSSVPSFLWAVQRARVAVREAVEPDARGRTTRSTPIVHPLGQTLR
jgi:O-antigen/teichoic acid export membrane protein